MFDLIFYKTINGREPAKEFIDSLDDKSAAKVAFDMKLLQIKGNLLGMPKSRALKDGLLELRTKTAEGITRIFYFFYVNENIILTNGYSKKKDKMDINEFEKAREYKRDFERREGSKIK